MGQESRLNPFAKEHRDLTITPGQVHDAFNRVLHEGDLIFLQVAVPPIFRVHRITKPLDPSAPANLLEITVSSTLKFAAPQGQVNQEFVRVIEASEAQPPTAKPSLEIVRPEEPTL
jgi:hypothetical protein